MLSRSLCFIWASVKTAGSPADAAGACVDANISCASRSCKRKPNRERAVWLPIKTHGRSQFRNALDEKLQLSKKLYEILENDPYWEVIYPPELSLMAISIKLSERPLKEINALNQRIIDEVKKIKRGPGRSFSFCQPQRQKKPGQRAGDHRTSHANLRIWISNDRTIRSFGSGRINVTIKSKVRRRKRNADTYSAMTQMRTFSEEVFYLHEMIY